MAKGEGVAPPMCRNCGEAHWKEAGRVCPKFRSPKSVKQPVPLRLPAPKKPKGRHCYTVTVPEMQPGAQAIHGLTQERLLAEGQPVVESLSVYSAAVQDGYTIVGYNVPFDLKVMRGELRRAGLADMFETTPSVCCMRPLTEVCRIPKAKGNGFKLPKLVEAYLSLFGTAMDGAHGALGDSTACARIFKELHMRGIFPAEPAKETV